METENRFKLIKIVVVINVLFLFSSCMMLSPNHLSGRHHSNANTINNSESNFDVVCGNPVSLQQPFYSTQYNNITYYFDTEECLNKFQQSPDSYLSKTSNNQKNNSLLYWGLGVATMGVMMFLMIN